MAIHQIMSRKLYSTSQIIFWWLKISIGINIYDNIGIEHTTGLWYRREIKEYFYL